jgi:hypothetical protein
MTKSQPTKEQCQLHHWERMRSAFGAYITPLMHFQCPSLATTDSIVPGGIRLRVCKACYDLRQQMSAKL